MLNKISLENFKGFSRLNELKLKPITILCGTNSCGKSSILQSILLLKQTMESKNPNQSLLLNGRFVHLGTFENIIYEKNLENCITFDIHFKITREDFARRRRGSVPLHFIFREMLSPQSLQSKQAVYNLIYRISLRTTKEKLKTHLKPINVEELSFRLETQTQENNIIPELSISFKQKDNDIYEVKWENLKFRFTKTGEDKKMNSGNAEAHIQFANLFPTLLGNQNELDQEKIPPEISLVVYRFSDLFKYIFDSYAYIGPLREEPSRRYIYEDEIVEIGNKGENAAYIFLSEKDKVIDYYFYNLKDGKFEEKSKQCLSEAIKNWLNFMGIKNLESEPISEIIYLSLNSNYSEKTRVNIADVGFGVSQIFPIILEGLRMSPRNTLLLEQPEIHLHPNLQMQMADYFIALALSGKNVIVETHSDHIINRLVRRVVEDQKFNLKDLVGIYFISSKDGKFDYEEVNIDETKGISNWPIDFFDQTANEQEKILQAGLKKRRIKEEN